MNTTQWHLVILAFLPLLWLLLSIGKLKIQSHIASVTGLFGCYLIAYIFFDMNISSIFEASLEGLMLAIFPILWVILSALFVYNITKKTGGMNSIKNMLSFVSPDRRIQALILAFGFGGFLESVAGFGTAVAIPAGILSVMGFNPLLAAIICLIANTIPVAFGVLGVPVITLANVTSLPLQELSIYTALQLIPLIIFLPSVIVTMVTKSLKGLKGVLSVSILSGIVFAVGQTVTVFLIGPELAAVIGSLASLVFIIFWIKRFPIKEVWLFESDSKSTSFQIKTSVKEGLVAWSPYILILLLVFITRFAPFMSFLDNFPFVLKKQFYFGEGSKPLTFDLGKSGGTILFISAIIGGIIQGASFKTILSTFIDTVIQIKKTILTVIAIVILAKIMGYSGMIQYVATFFVLISGKFYPLIAPLIGATGTFITGSDTSSNVLFGNLQTQAAIKLNLDKAWIVAANASGATAGKMISPQSISIAIAASGLSGSESKILTTTIKYCIIYVLLLGLIVYLFRTSFI